MRSLTPLLLALATFGCAATESESTKPTEPTKASASATPTFQEQMEAMMRVGQPVAQHKALDAFAGSWDAKVTMWGDPGMPPMTSNGTCVNTWIWDGRYLEQKFEGDMAGEKFWGTGTWGYDVAAKKYFGTWIDSGSTGMSYSVGDASSDGKTFTLVTTMTDPISGKPVTSEAVFTVQGPDQHTMVVNENRGGKKVKSMEIVYTRKK